MAKEYAEHFYNSKAWQHCRTEYKKSVGGLCERCKAKGQIVAGEIVHHKTKITPGNINDPNITLNWNNLELLCRDCHKEEHAEETYKRKNKKRFKINQNGELIITPPRS